MKTTEEYIINMKKWIADNDVKVGDLVIVTRNWEQWEGGTYDCPLPRSAWESVRNRVLQILRFEEESIVAFFRDGEFCYSFFIPYFCLSKIPYSEFIDKLKDRIAYKLTKTKFISPRERLPEEYEQVVFITKDNSNILSTGIYACGYFTTDLDYEFTWKTPEDVLFWTSDILTC